MIRESFILYGNVEPEPDFDEIDSAGPYATNPLLSREELGDLIDLRYLLPDETQKQLTDDEVVVRINNINLDTNASTPSNLKLFMALTGVDKLHQIGEKGPSIAALPGSQEVLDTAQNRFVAPHIRDAILTARLREDTPTSFGEILRLRFPKLMRSTLLYTAEQGGITDEEFDPGRPYRQEKPGKTMLVNFGLEDPGGRKFSRYLGWGWPIYTSVDAAPLFIAEAADYTLQEEPDFLGVPYVARDGQEHLFGQFFDLAIDRLIADLKDSKEGFLEFKNLDPREGMGMFNQGWADSAGAYVHKNSDWANHKSGIAPVEVQGYAYEALIKAAAVYREIFKEPEKADQLDEIAKRLRSALIKMFLVSDEQGTYAAMGRDYDDLGNGRNLAVRHVNMGLLLETGILDGDDPETVNARSAIIESLFSEGMITKFGIRTLDKHEKPYRPGGDHVGQIWPHINEAVARGLLRYGYTGLAQYLRKGNWLIYMETRATPEYIRGDSDISVKENSQEIVVWNKKYKRMYMFEIPGQRYQAWSNEAVLAAKYSYQPLRKQSDNEINEFEKSILLKLPGQTLSN